MSDDQLLPAEVDEVLKDLEHKERVERFVEEYRRYIADGGTLLGSPNAMTRQDYLGEWNSLDFYPQQMAYDEPRSLKMRMDWDFRVAMPRRTSFLKLDGI